jgi:hypothetical protein
VRVLPLLIPAIVLNARSCGYPLLGCSGESGSGSRHERMVAA